ncbi:Uncharacterised protein [Bordetella pertussis]|nr:Uncharacterised protein [Bordetella pertussis]
MPSTYCNACGPTPAPADAAPATQLLLVTKG